MVPSAATGGWGLRVQPRSPYARFCRSVSASAILLCCLSFLIYVTLYQLLILLFYLSDLRFPISFSPRGLLAALQAPCTSPPATSSSHANHNVTQHFILCNFIHHQIT